MTIATDFYRFACDRCLQIHSDTVPCPRPNVRKLDAFEQAQEECPAPPDDPLATARGLGWGILFAIPLWVLVMAVVWWLW